MTGAWALFPSRPARDFGFRDIPVSPEWWPALRIADRIPYFRSPPKQFVLL